jgi:hypothetical protein
LSGQARQPANDPDYPHEALPRSALPQEED